MSKSKRRRSRRSNRDIEFLETALVANGEAKAKGPQRKKWSTHDLKTIKPLTRTQEDMFHAWFNYDHICAYGTAGTGKTFLALYLALVEVLVPSTPTDKIKIIRSVVPTRDMGFLPGTEEEKMAVYETPYRNICAELVGRSSTYDDMKEAGKIDFESTSFLRGQTWDDTIVIVDEGQNMSYHEIDTIMTRLGENTRLIFTGDLAQSDFDGRKEESGMGTFIQIVRNISDFGLVQFTHPDIVRSNIVKQWIIASERFNNPSGSGIGERPGLVAQRQARVA